MDDFKNATLALVATLICCYFLPLFEITVTFGTYVAVFLAFYPWKFDGDVYSLFGGFNKEGKVYSLFEIHAVGKEVKSIISFSFFSKSTDGPIFSFFGFYFCAEAEADVGVCLGALVFCTGKSCLIMIGVAVCCFATDLLFFIVGVDIFSTSCENADFFCGAPILTKVENDITLFCGMQVLTRSGRCTFTRIGIPVVVFAEECAVLGVGIPLGQFAKKGSYVSWSKCSDNDGWF